ncbi:MAG: asparagine synthase (glutamine-hydrolyzing) [Desulfocapsa sp.]|nr:asparagine synthase (glutamine-hydrolyzing) [Desulfocapsa sp.]
MCGIAGYINKSKLPVDKEKIHLATRLVKHRGPDGEGFFFGTGFAFGHRRLMIHDLSSKGHQPMVSRDGRFVLVYNGEIYNYLELRNELRDQGRRFVSQCDTEVVLEAYQEWGSDCVKKFNGMWAFAIYDATKEVIFCSRDRFGIKPFYYVESSATFIFGSEIKQLLPFLSKPTANYDVLVNFLLTSITDHNEETFFQDIVKLPAGHNLIYSLAECKVTIERYYQLEKKYTLSQLSPLEATMHYRELLDDSISLRLRSDVRVGTCLSGGLDSSSIATLAAEKYCPLHSGQAFAAITAVSTQKDNDESAYAKIVVEHSGLQWITVRPSYADFNGIINNVAVIQEEPFGSPSLVMQYFVMLEARKNGITVLLDGQGGDETLLGYPKYYAAYLVEILQNNGARKAVASMRKLLANDDNLTLRRLAMYLLAGLSASSRYRYYCRKHSYMKQFPLLPEHLTAFSKSCYDIFALQKLENVSTNLPVLLRYEDKSSMAHSVEARLPFLDYRLVESALSYSSELKIHNGWSKWLLREVMKNKMPDKIVWRRDKRGFEAPEKKWIPRHHAIMKKVIYDSSVLSQCCDMDKMLKMFAGLDFRSQWRLYSVALWERAFQVTH